VPLFAEELNAGPDGCQEINILTDGLEPGYYDIRLGMPDGSVEWIRIELVA
jgi:hypothetical protein